MSLTLTVQTDTDQEQRLKMPGTYTWQEFETLAGLLESGGVRLTYLDGAIELMTVSEAHERLKSMLRLLLETYLLLMEIEFFPVGNATRSNKAKSVSFEPDESYYLFRQDNKTHPDLAIEVILSSGSIAKLEKYRRLGIPEVWFWEDNRLEVYVLEDSSLESLENLENNRYVLVSQSQLLPFLDLALLMRCTQMNSTLEAVNTFRQQ